MCYIFLIVTTRMIPLSTSTLRISKQERATGFGRWGERVANVPLFSVLGNLGGDTLGDGRVILVYRFAHGELQCSVLSPRGHRLLRYHISQMGLTLQQHLGHQLYIPHDKAKN